MREEADASYSALRLPARDGSVSPLVLLHGSNGDELDLLDLGAAISPGAARLAVRGDVPMDPGWAFFRRFPDRRIDVEDLRSRAAGLATFVERTGAEESWARKPIMVGYSNGAITAIAVMLRDPRLLAGAILLRPLLPFPPPSRHDLTGLPVLVVDGMGDERREPQDGAQVRDALRSAGAVVRHQASSSGHAVGPDDAAIAREWMDERESRGPGLPEIRVVPGQ